MLTELVVENFKGFGTRQRVPLAPLTLIYGGNSAGKSSLIQALLLMKQSIGTPDRMGPSVGREAELVVRGNMADLGSFDALVHRHEREREVSVGWSSPMTRTLASRVGARVRPSLETSASLTFGRPRGAAAITHVRSSVADATFEPISRELDARMNRGADRYMMRESSRLVATEADTLLLLNQALDGLAFEPRGPMAALQADPAAREALLTSAARTGARLIVADWSGIPMGALGFESNLGFVSIGDFPQQQTTLMAAGGELEMAGRVISGWITASGRSARSSINSIDYLGPMRKAPERLHILSGEAVRGSGSHGEHVVDLLARRADIREETNEWFTRLDIPYSLDVRTVTDKAVAGAIGEVHCLLLKDRRGVEVSPTDVGFGIGQVLPVITQACLSDRATLCIEQPEIHLHPGLQARLAELFASKLRQGRETQFILETHSEHLILRIQRLIRRKVLAPEQVSVIFVGTDSSGDSSVSALRLDDAGEFRDEWPGGFFDERYDELFGE